jgi:hypothetical protein
MADAFVPYTPPVSEAVAATPAPSAEVPVAPSVAVSPAEHSHTGQVLSDGPKWKQMVSDVADITNELGMPVVATAEATGLVPANVAPVVDAAIVTTHNVAAAAATAPDPAAAVLAGANVVISAESGWETSEGQMSLAFKAMATTLGTLVATDQLSLPATVKGWVLAGIAVAVAVEQGAYAVGRSVRKRGTTG